jgi:hypothetical protein
MSGNLLLGGAMRSTLSCAVIAGALFLSANARAIPCPTTRPLLFIVQDESGSMGDAPDPSCGSCDSKWDMSTQAVTDLTTKFSSRFDFALEFFPADATSCSAGTVVASYPSTASDIHDAYNNGAPGGSTPTAISLDSARSYLNSLNLSVDAYVLLITDGEPNCNSSLNPDTCQWSSTGCDPSSCSAESCLDDKATVSAAKALKAAGFPVYVVGFGSDIESNLTVLNAVAAAGGTGQAYSATDEASLSTQLDKIAAQVSNCCISVCVSGQKDCDPTGNQMVCEADPTDATCLAWTINTCALGFVCSGGSCQACQNTCNDGDYRCNGGSVDYCKAGAGGCYDWAHYADCDLGYTCFQGACISCTPCTLNDTRCSDPTDQQTCVSDWATGLFCTQWSPATTCPDGQQCSGGACANCDACTPGGASCEADGFTIITCQRVNGCAIWVSGDACPNGEFCSQGLCGQCGPACTGGCDGNSVIVCGAQDVHGCDTFTEQACTAGTTCVAGACSACPATCTPGSQVCSGNNIMVCQQQPSGCYGVELKDTCPSGQVCSLGQCTTPCSDACTEGDTKCNGGVPDNCVKAANGCTAWQAGTKCVAPQVCAAGGCRDACTGGEIESCAPGYICTTLAGGRLCIPVAQPDGGSVTPITPLDAGGGLIDDPDAGKGTPAKHADAGTVAPGGSGSCGCSAAGAPLALLAPLLLLPWWRRRS